MSILFEQLENFIERYHNALTSDKTGLADEDDIPMGPARDFLISLTKQTNRQDAEE